MSGAGLDEVQAGAATRKAQTLPREATSIVTQGLLFDMDGVLISSIAGVNRCWRRWAAHYRVPNAENVTVAHGTRAVDLIKAFRPDLNDQDVKAGLRLIEDMEIEDVADLEVLPGVRQLLGSLPSERWTIVTSATRRLLLGRLKAAKLPFPGELIAGDDVIHGKPHPEPYRKGAKLLGFPPEDCIVVEDAPSGVGAGVAAGSQVLGVLGTYAPEELYAAGAAWVVKSLDRVNVTAATGGLRLDFVAV
jgi:sugar-phosphatase